MSMLLQPSDDDEEVQILQDQSSSSCSSDICSRGMELHVQGPSVTRDMQDEPDYALFPELGLHQLESKQGSAMNLKNGAPSPPKKRVIFKIKMNRLGEAEVEEEEVLNNTSSNRSLPKQDKMSMDGQACSQLDWPGAIPESNGHELSDESELALDLLHSSMNSYMKSTAAKLKKDELPAVKVRNSPINITSGDGKFLSIKEVVETDVLQQITDALSADAQDDLFDESGKKMTKNAINARENRERKKKYIAGLEKSVRELSNENTLLKHSLSDQESMIGTLRKDVVYLKGVLANQSHLSALLQNIQNTPGVKFGTSLESSLPLTEDGLGSSQETFRKRKTESEVERDSVTPCKPLTKVPRLQKCDHAYNRRITRNSVNKTKTVSQRDNGSIGRSDENALVRDRDVDLNDASGICLHVSKGNVSLEFCAACSSNAASGFKGNS